MTTRYAAAAAMMGVERTSVPAKLLIESLACYRVTSLLRPMGGPVASYGRPSIRSIRKVTIGNSH